MSQLSEILADMDAVGSSIERAEAELAAGAVLDLASFEHHIEELCTRVQGLPPGEAREVQSRLLALADAFGHLAQSIEATMSELKTEMGQVSGRQRAASAYAKSSEPNR